MKNKSVLSVLTLILCIALVFCACTSNEQTSVDAGVVTRLVDDDEQAAQAAGITAENISFYEVTDGDYKIKISPIYNKDGKSVVAAYIVAVTDKTNKAIGADKFPMLMNIVSASSDSSQIKLQKDKNGNYIKIESYADSKGNLIAIKDVSDWNSNGKTDEYIKLRAVTNSEGSTHYLLTSETVNIVKEKGKTYAVENGKKVEVKIVDAKNTSVKNNVEEKTANKKEKEQIKKENTTKKPSSKSNTTTKPANPNDMGADTNSKTKSYIQIVLLKDGMAKTGSKNVDCKQNEVTINKGGDYLIASEVGTWHGVIKCQLKNTEEAELRFEDVNISYNRGSVIQLIDSTESGERSFLEAEASEASSADDTLNDAMEEYADRTSAPDVSLSFPSGTASNFESSANASTGVIYNESKLDIKGNGKLTVAATTNTNNAICSSKALTFKNATVKLETAAYGSTSGIGGARGIFSYGKVNIESGNLTIHSNGDAIRCTRFNQEGGTLNATSSACDGIDSESSISISGGEARVYAIQKSSYKVRRVNLQERYDNGERVNKTDLIRSSKGDGFHISGGKVIGESKKVSDYGMTPSQYTFVCRTVKKTKGSSAETKAPVKWGVSTFASSDNSCVKFLYSSSGISNKDYKVQINNKEREYKWTWNGKLGACYVTYSNTN
ncbi:MAG: carbohydrate-binding domain-containing protein [Eubacterium sp.]|nr:carbohydrate-binding domain-containing protein [Eubacterium sp.]